MLKACVSLLIFCLDYLTIDECEMLNSLSIIVLLSVSPFTTVSICLMYMYSMFGAYILTIVTSYWIDLLIIIQCPLSLITVFIWKFILSDILVLLLPLPFHLHLSGIPFSILLLCILLLCVSLDLKCVSCAQKMYGSCFYIHSANLVFLLEHLTHFI